MIAQLPKEGRQASGRECEQHVFFVYAVPGFA